MSPVCESLAIGRAITTVVALVLIVSGLVVGLTAETVNGARLIACPLIALTGLALLVRLARVTRSSVTSGGLS